MNDFLCVFVDFSSRTVELERREMFNLTILMSPFICSVFVLTKGVFLTVNNMTRLIRSLR